MVWSQSRVLKGRPDFYGDFNPLDHTNSTIMGSSLARNDIHIVFHIKYHSMEIRDEDLGQVFAYIGGVIRNMDGIPVEIGGIGNHIHILTSLPKAISLSDFVKKIKAYSSKWIKTLEPSL